MLEEVQLKLEEVDNADIEYAKNNIVLEPIVKIDSSRKPFIESFWLANEKNFADEDKSLINKYLLNISIDKLISLSKYSFKSVKKARLFAIFLGGFGADRVYVGDIGLGFCKCILGSISFGIWWLVDIFLIGNVARQKNLATFKEIVQQDMLKKIIEVNYEKN